FGMVQDDESIRLLRTHASVVHLAESALAAGSTLTRTVEQILDTTLLDYAPIYAGASEWWILPSIDRPSEPTRCIVSDTELTHTHSAANRQAMHAAGAQVTDSMRMKICVNPVPLTMH